MVKFFDPGNLDRLSASDAGHRIPAGRGGLGQRWRKRQKKRPPESRCQ
ncbi:hypothetical protein KCP69_23475 [Salmonella enterica subsp. enterica]|nr:hypothetical protein KCP69_23475 [Salmonella enterica subsp. enterica]